MTIRKRQILCLAGASLLTGFSTLEARAQAAWPNQPIKLIVPYPAGGGTDFFARLVAPGMGDALGQPVVVDNRPGASGIIGASAVTRTLPADGYTLLLGDMTTYAVNASMYEKLPYDTLRDLSPVTMTAKFDFVLVVNPQVLNVNNVAELVAAAQKASGGLNYASPSIGTTHHLAMELFAREARINLVAVHYKGGGPAMQDLLAGQVGVMFLDRASARPHIESGKLRPIAAAGSRRIAALPNVPTMAESGIKGFDVEGWQGFTVRKGTPEAIIQAMNAAYVKAIAPTDIRKKLADAGIDPVAGTPAQFGGYIQDETTRWRNIVRERGIKAE
jgi:tripartite-type tricarboxylate transporter receptor subunit TctC